MGLSYALVEDQTSPGMVRRDIGAKAFAVRHALLLIRYTLSREYETAFLKAIESFIQQLQVNYMIPYCLLGGYWLRCFVGLAHLRRRKAVSLRRRVLGDKNQGDFLKVYTYRHMHLICGQQEGRHTWAGRAPVAWHT